MNKYVTEFIGTFFLVLTVGCTAIAGAPGVIPPLAIGAALMVMVYAGGHVSGAHYNPAVTVGVFIRGRCPAGDAALYMMSQVVGAAAAAAVVMFLKTGAAFPAAYWAPVMPAIVAELLFTFALVYVVLNVATAKANTGNSFYGLAIGMTVMVATFAVGDISGGAFNPAVAIGASFMGVFPWWTLWIYLVAEFLGGAAAAVVFKIVNPTDN